MGSASGPHVMVPSWDFRGAQTGRNNNLVTDDQHVRSGDVTVVIPCLNEAEALPDVLARIPDGYRALVVDNGSSDGTADVARSCGVDVVHQPIPGYGSAVDAGVRAATSDIVCTIDGDGSMEPADLIDLVTLLDNGADLAVGRRRPVERGVCGRCIRRWAVGPQRDG